MAYFTPLGGDFGAGTIEANITTLCGGPLGVSMPLFGHHNNAPAGGLRPNEMVMGTWKTHQGDLQLTNQRCLLLKGGGMPGIGGGHHDVSWGVELEQIQNMQVVGSGGQSAGTVAASSAGSVASSYSPVSGLGNPLGSLTGHEAAQLIINGMSFHFHQAGHASQAQAQIQSAKDTKLQQMGGAPAPGSVPPAGMPPPPPPPPPPPS